jgi:uncharacterized protein YjbI with pentapeptide repeats
MANEEHLKLVRSGVEALNAWRRSNRELWADLSGADLSGADLSWADLVGADLRGTNLSGANLWGARVTGAALEHANLSSANLCEATIAEAGLDKADLRMATLGLANLTVARLSRANLSGANLIGANLHGTNLSGADLSGVNLSGANVLYTNLFGARLTGARVGATVFASVDLSQTEGLETLTHEGPSTIGVDTLYLSQSHLPEVFLRGVGLPEEFITQIPALLASVKPLEFQSCFISYSHRDQEFSQRLHSRMRSENLRVWYAPEDMKGGRKIHEEIFRAIQIHDKLLLVLSENSMKSEWVNTEIRRAKKVERQENRRKLFPIRLVDVETIQKWECFDGDSGTDLAAELREYYIPDFSRWKDHDAFENEFAKLLRALEPIET